MLARALASPALGVHHTMDFGISIFIIYVSICAALRNLGLLIKTDWSAIRPFVAENAGP